MQEIDEILPIEHSQWLQFLHLIIYRLVQQYDNIVVYSVYYLGSDNIV